MSKIFTQFAGAPVKAFENPKTPSIPDQGKSADQLVDEQLAGEREAAEGADREVRIRNARRLLRGQTISGSPLGSPLSGVGSTRPRLGRG